jgi:hypothetical protein
MTEMTGAAAAIQLKTWHKAKSSTNILNRKQVLFAVRKRCELLGNLLISKTLLGQALMVITNALRFLRTAGAEIQATRASGRVECLASPLLAICELRTNYENAIS